MMGFFFYTIHAFVWHPSRTIFTVHASRTHVKAPQTDFPVKHDNSSGLTHDSPSERHLRTKATFQPQKHRKASRTPSRKRTTQAKHVPTFLTALTFRESGPRPEGQHRSQDVFLLDAQSHGRSSESIRSVPMAPCHCHRNHRGRLSSLYAPNPFGSGLARLRNAPRLPAGSRLTLVSPRVSI